MPEMTHVGEHHCEAVLIGCGDNLLVMHGASGLDYCLDAGFCCGVNAISEWEKSIGRHRCTL